MVLFEACSDEGELIGGEVSEADRGDGVDLSGVGGELDSDIVFGEADMKAVADAALDEHLGQFALVGLVEGESFAFGNLVEDGVSGVALGDGDDGFDVEGFGAGAFGVCEDVELCDVEGVDEGACLFEKLGGLAINAYDDVDSDESVGYEFFYGVDFLGVEVGVVASAHESEHGVGSGLEWYVEMGHEFMGGGGVSYDVVGEEVWFYGGDSESFDSLDFFETLDELE